MASAPDEYLPLRIAIAIRMAMKTGIVGERGRMVGGRNCEMSIAQAEAIAKSFLGSNMWCYGRTGLIDLAQDIPKNRR
jgi:hypothetical protein